MAIAKSVINIATNFDTIFFLSAILKESSSNGLPATVLYLSIYKMPTPPSSGRPGARAPPLPPPSHRDCLPQNDADPDHEVFDPNRTPPPPADAIFRENSPEEKLFQIPPLRQVSTRRRPLTGRPPAPLASRGIKLPKEAVSKRTTWSSRRAGSPPDANQNHLEVIQKSLHQIQSYLDTLAVLATQKNLQPPPHLPP